MNLFQNFFWLDFYIRFADTMSKLRQTLKQMNLLISFGFTNKLQLLPMTGGERDRQLTLCYIYIIISI